VSRRIFQNVFGLKHVIAFVGKLTDPHHNEKLMRMLWSSVPKMLIIHAEMMNFPLPSSRISKTAEVPPPQCQTLCLPHLQTW
jgi:hypothetical protein